MVRSPMMMPRTLLLGLLCSLLLLLAGMPPSAQAQPAPAPGKQPGVGYRVGDIAPELTLLDQHDNPVSLSEFRGKHVLLYFSAAWCGPCMYAATISEEFVRRLNELGEPTALVEVLVDNLYGDPAETIDAIDWAEEFDLTSPVLHPSGEYNSPALQQFRGYGKNAFPTTVLLSPHGRIISVTGGFSFAKLEADVLRLRSSNERLMIDRLLTTVERLGWSAERSARLRAPLLAALLALDRGDRASACPPLVSFAGQVQAQTQEGLGSDTAAALLEGVRSIQAMLACQ